jgi:hypothetical protein
MTRFDKLFFVGLAVVVAVLVVVALYASGCSAVQSARARPNVTDARGITWNDARCYELLQTADNWTFTSKILVGSGGTSALAAPVGGAISDDEREQKRIEWGFGIAAGISAGAGLAALWMGEKKRDEFEEFCQVEPDDDLAAPPAHVADILAPMPVEWVEYDGGVKP